MLNNDYYYFGFARKYMAIFGTIFKDLVINRTIPDGTVTQIIDIPISYAQKEKMMVRMKEDSTISRQAAITLPRISFFFDGLEYDAERKVNSINRIIYMNQNSTVKTQYAEVPYNFYFSLYIYVKNSEDGTKIIEQILPFFKPEYTVRAFLIPNHESFDIPIELVEVSHENTDTEKFSDDAVLIWTLKFRIRGLLFGPFKDNIKTISNTELDFSISGGYSNTQFINVNSFGISSNNYANNLIISPIIEKIIQ
jgi:hypothetical protein